jgi:acrylyl-CoA reductase (NADPH)
VTVAVEYSTLNYKDGLCIGPGGGLVRKYPACAGDRLRRHRGGLRRRPLQARRQGRADRLARRRGALGRLCPEGPGEGGLAGAAARGADDAQAMAVGTAGFTAMLAIMALEDHGIDAGATARFWSPGRPGGVGSVATAILANLGYEVAAVTGRPETEGLPQGARRQPDRAPRRAGRDGQASAGKETWAGCVDAVGGAMLARVLGQMKYGASVAAVGLAGGARCPPRWCRSCCAV